MSVKLKQVGALSVGDVDVASVSFDKFLDSSELVASVDDVVDLGSVLVIDNKVVSTAQLTILQHPIAIGRAIQFRVDASSAVAGTTYTLKITITTDATPSRTKNYEYDIKVAD